MRRGFGIPKRMGPGALEHRGARHLRYKRRISGRHQYDLRIRQRVAFELQSRGYVRIVDRHDEAGSCLSPRPHLDLAMSKVTSLIRWRHAPPQELADGLSSVPAACRLAHMTGGVSACDEGSRRLRDSIRCSIEMLRQIRAGVKLSERQ